jgi:hypothetical protein
VNKIAFLIAVIALVALAVQPNSGQASHVPPGTYNYVLSNWVWEVEKDGFSYWRSPDCTVGSVDLRSLPQQGALGPLSQGYGFFATESACPLPVGAIVLSDDLASAPPSATLNTLESLFRVRDGALDGVNTEEVVWRLLTSHADPSGANGPKPIMPGTSLNLELRLGGHSLVRSERYDRNVHTHVLEVLRLDYERIKIDSLSRDDETYLKVAGYWRDKYSFDVRTEEQKLDGIRKPETTFTESFDTADSDTLGPDLTWTELSGDWDVVSNQTASTSNVADNIAVPASPTHDLSSDDHYAQFDWVSIATAASETLGPIIRVVDANNYYMGFYRVANQWELWKRIGGTYTQLGVDLSANAAPATSVKVQVDGSTLELFRDGVSQGTRTDTALTGQLRVGIRGSPALTAHVIDDFEAADLASPSPRRIINVIGSMVSIWERRQYARPR